MESVKEKFDKPLPDDSVVVACFVLRSRDAGHLIEIVREAFAKLPHDVPASPLVLPTIAQQSEPVDAWLSHDAAAAYLGVSKSTLYHYSCYEQVERRKLGGRLEYRRSVLDKFKEAHTLPARTRPNAESIITSAHSSGK